MYGAQVLASSEPSKCVITTWSWAGPPPDAFSCPGSPPPHDSWSQSAQVEAHNVKRGEKDGPQEVTEALAVSPPTNPTDNIYIRWGAGVDEASLTQ